MKWLYNTDADCYEAVMQQLYEASFPPEERREMIDWKLFEIVHPAFRRCAVERDGTFVGILYFWQFAHMNYIEHFAILPGQRSMGIGSTVLRAFMHQHNRIVLEVEPPQTQEAKRRVQFYRNCGLHLCNTPYVQPPYSIDRQSVPLFLMSNRADWLRRNFNNVVATLRREVYGKNS